MLKVTSEIGRLRRVLVHEPGPEVDVMVPAMMEDLLFDDILFGDRAREEHGMFRRLLQLCGIEVIDTLGLLSDVLAKPEARAFALEVLEDLPHALVERLLAMQPAQLARTLVAGLQHDSARHGVEVDDLFALSPLPNWCFQRDPQVILGSGVIHCAMATPARHREAILARLLFGFHPELQPCPVLFDPLASVEGRRMLATAQPPHLEGGDVLVFSPEVLAVGHSERTNRRGIRRLARALARRDDGPRWLFVIMLPRRRAYMHLDTLITPIDHDACLVYPPVIVDEGAERARVFEADLHAGEIAFASCEQGLLPALKRRGVDLKPVACGGHDRVVQQREQWTDGANALSLAPGRITIYQRNRGTAEALSREGFRIVKARDVLLGRDEFRLDRTGRTCVLLPSHEISRARGGPHCLAHPLLRDDPA